MEKDLNKLEQRILDEEIKEFTAEVKRGAAIIVAAIEKYADKIPMVNAGVGFKGLYREEVKKLVISSVGTTICYFAGDYTAFTKAASLYIPEFLKERMLTAALDKFFDHMKTVNAYMEGMGE